MSINIIFSNVFVKWTFSYSDSYYIGFKIAEETIHIAQTLVQVTACRGTGDTLTGPQWVEANRLTLLRWTKWPPFHRSYFQIVPKSPVDNRPILGQIVALRLIGDKPLSELMPTQFTDAYMQHAGRWVNKCPCVGIMSKLLLHTRIVDSYMLFRTSIYSWHCSSDDFQNYPKMNLVLVLLDDFCVMNFLLSRSHVYSGYVLISNQKVMATHICIGRLGRT